MPPKSAKPVAATAAADRPARKPAGANTKTLATKTSKTGGGLRKAASTGATKKRGVSSSCYHPQMRNANK